jgi:hypothetical protein
MAKASTLTRWFARRPETPLRAPRRDRKAAVAGSDVSIQVTVRPHNDRTRAAAAQFQADDFTLREEKLPQRIITERMDYTKF